MYQDFSPIIIFILLAIALVILPLILQSLMSPKKNKGGDKLISYECGELPEGSAWVKFNIRFYIIALIFIIFDVEVIFMFPWAVVFQDLGLLAFIEMMLFLMILICIIISPIINIGNISLVTLLLIILGVIGLFLNENFVDYPPSVV